MSRQDITPEKPDPLSNEVALVASVDATGLSIKAKSRFISAADRLLGGLLDVPAAALDGRARQRRARDYVQEQLIIADGAAAVRALDADQTAGRRALQVFADTQTRKQSNRDAVILEAMEVFNELHPPGETPNDSQAADDELDEDWLNIFGNHAENASSDRLRTLWGRILAGEVRKPGTFSLSALRMISELDKETAELFQEALVNRIDEALVKPDKLEGHHLINLVTLEERGFLQEVNGTLAFTLKAQQDGILYFHNKSWLIRIKAHNPTQDLDIPIIRITKSGQEIASILPSEPAEVGLRAAAKILDAYAETIELGEPVFENGMLKGHRMTFLKPPASQPAPAEAKPTQNFDGYDTAQSP